MSTNQLTARVQTKRKTIAMLMTVVIVFAICWLPLNVYHVINDFVTIDSAPLGLPAFLACHWLAVSSVCWNPFIYFGVNPDYRRSMRRLFTTWSRKMWKR